MALLNLPLCEQGLDHSCDGAAARVFARRFHKAELLEFAACRLAPYRHVHHILTFEGERQYLLAEKLIEPNDVPASLRRSRVRDDRRVESCARGRLRVVRVLWDDRALTENDALAAFCPSRWPIIEHAEDWRAYMRGELEVSIAPLEDLLKRFEDGNLGFRLAAPELSKSQSIMAVLQRELRQCLTRAPVADARTPKPRLIIGGKG